MSRLNIELLPAELRYGIIECLNMDSLRALIAASPVFLAQYIAYRSEIVLTCFHNTLGRQLPEALLAWWTKDVERGSEFFCSSDASWLLTHGSSAFPLAEGSQIPTTMFWIGGMHPITPRLELAAKEPLTRMVDYWNFFTPCDMQQLVSIQMFLVDLNVRDLILRDEWRYYAADLLARACPKLPELFACVQIKPSYNLEAVRNGAKVSWGHVLWDEERLERVAPSTLSNEVIIGRAEQEQKSQKFSKENV
ncbi:hypothetical protein QBC44DRAFT_310692 [Cladorrhinum sp. PSN332]|nr:hypothetical protein QBC44DRAFT_310692 [Cladorrhinum sp. PSN332]